MIRLHFYESVYGNADVKRVGRVDTSDLPKFKIGVEVAEELFFHVFWPSVNADKSFQVCSHKKAEVHLKYGHFKFTQAVTLYLSFIS